MPPIRYAPSVDPNYVLVSIDALKDAFFGGIDSFLVDAFADKARAPIVEDRLKALLHEMPAEEQTPNPAAT